LAIGVLLGDLEFHLFGNFPGQQREWISRARLIIGLCIFVRVDSLLWQLGTRW